MKRVVVLFTAIGLILMTSMYTVAQKGPKPVDPMGKGNGVLGFVMGAGVPYYGVGGFGPAFIAKYDHSIWQAGPGTVSLGGMIGTSYFWDTYNNPSYNYDETCVNMGIVFRAAYHYGWNVPGLDTYAGFGAGTRFSFYSDDWDDDNGKSSTNVGFLPTVFFGTSYFFNDLVGVNGEVGHNFTYAHIGVVLKIK